ncbi:uncharacterized protein UV8b_01643 [Ustilaginoidea virens]|uniref:Structure-specific endonuclease subunit SLX4 n=1 Tax=Ustilaginoidea virens TaxID=1159556 RepID=A0A8E5MF57_USTVR|nr:uncharacterized protein UV8b_01643 [Ustilaginoidea virens]QUC17402.1 hypothetical protein UV8b_01643 [Ustilaginoidea virens]
MTRRTDWTPPPARGSTIVISDGPSSDVATFEQDGQDHARPFGTLVASYRCTESPFEEAAPYQSDGSDTKRRKLTGSATEKIGRPTPGAAAKQVAKKKAPRKKPRTITAIATAAYKTASQAEPADTPPQTITPQPLIEVAKQDFVFGTSSQLAREQSPTFLRSLQKATQEFNALEEVPFRSPLNSDAIEPPERGLKLWGAAARDADGDLFDIQVIDLMEEDSAVPQTARDADPYGYFRAEDRSSSCLHDRGARAAGSAVTEGKGYQSDTLPGYIDDRSNAADPSNRSELPKMRPINRSSSTTVETISSTTATARTSQRPQSPGRQPLPGSNAGNPPPPAWESYTDAQLCKTLSRYGFKPIKRRPAMIALLQQILIQTNQVAPQQVRSKSTVGSRSSEAAATKVITPKKARGRPRRDVNEEAPAQDPPPSAQAPETPKRPRGRPRKGSQTTSPTKAKNSEQESKSKHAGQVAAPRKSKTKKVTEIDDSESELGSMPSSSPGSSPGSSVSGARQIDLAMSVDEDTELSLAMTPTDAQSNLFSHISEAVTTAPRATDPARPSWHEKILLYDPIVLEDLAAWLNSGPLSRVGYDGEVNPVEVKKWCESKSICCLWKVNLRGKERKRY